ncbi:deaminase [Candidatus Saccharibacteria bacterium]|nr:deaminase [Candidatus Saccharibacteria bacterium]MCL1962828.1 deaminase [Candidatus Saccharibacteria bacterium]
MKIDDLIAPLKKLAKVPKAQLGGVSCFFIKNGAIISSGINHNPTGAPMEDEIDGKLVTRPEVIHAEVSAIAVAAKNGVDLCGSTLLITMSPCIKCATEIAKTGISELYYLYEWWDKAALDMLRGNGVKVTRVKEVK